MGLKIKNGRLTCTRNMRNIKPPVKKTNFVKKTKSVVRGLDRKKII